MSENLTIGERIATARRHKSLTQSELSELTGKSRSSIAQIEKGITRPDFEFIEQIVRICNTSFEYIHGLSTIIKYDDFLRSKMQDIMPLETNDKSGFEGVRIEDKKGGKDGGKDGPFLKNQMYIKSDSPHRRVSENVEGYQIPPARVIDLTESYQDDFWQHIAEVGKKQSELVILLQERIRRLEEDISNLKGSAKNKD